VSESSALGEFTAHAVTPPLSPLPLIQLKNLRLHFRRGYPGCAFLRLEVSLLPNLAELKSETNLCFSAAYLSGVSNLPGQTEPPAVSMPVPAARPLSVDEAVAEALEANPEIQASVRGCRWRNSRPQPRAASTIRC